MSPRDKEHWAGGRSFRMVRYFSIANLVCILIAALLLLLLFRKVTIDTLVELGERGNLALAEATLDSIRPELVDYFIAAEAMSGGRAGPQPLDETLLHALNNLAHRNEMLRLKLYNHWGEVVFSTQPTQVGEDQQYNPGFAAAIQGGVVSKLIYRDSFNYFDRKTEDDNLIQTYIPVRFDEDSPILGVFEIYTDVDPLVYRIETASVLVGGGVVLVLVLLYSLLGAIVRWANRIIRDQQTLIQQRTKTLELLSAQMLTAQEDEKKRIAGDLHEGIAQTLSAVLSHVEAACHHLEKGDPVAEIQTLRSLQPPIRNAIKEISAFAMDLRPASLDDFGLVATLTWWFEEFALLYPGLQIEPRLEIEEEAIPAPLKVVIYRIVQDALTAIAKERRAKRVQLALEKQIGQVTLTIDDDGVAYHPAKSSQDGDSPREVGLAMIKERTILSGGSFHLDSNRQGGTVRQASWIC